MQSNNCSKKFSLIAAFAIILIGEFAEHGRTGILLSIAFLLTAVYSYLCEESQLFYFMLLLVAPNRILTLGPISAPSIVMLVGVFRMVLQKRFRIKPRFLFLSFLLLSVSLLTYINGASQLFSSAKIIIVLCFIYMYTETKHISQTYIELTEACATGCILTSLLTIAINPSSLYDSFRFSLTGSGGENVLGILCAIMALNLIYIVLYSDVNRLKYITYVGVLVIVGLLTGSRSALICLLIGFIGIFFISLFKRSFKQAFVLLLITFAIVIIGYYSMQGDNIISIYIERFIYRSQKRANNDISNGRYELWAQYIDVFKNNSRILFFGGMDIKKYGINIVAHNMIIEQLACYGIIGSIILVSLYLGVLSGIKELGGAKYRLVSSATVPMIALLIVSFFSHTLLGIPQTMMLLICALGIMEEKE